MIKDAKIDDLQNGLTVFPEFCCYMTMLLTVKQRPATIRIVCGLTFLQHCDIRVLQYIVDSGCVVDEAEECAAAYAGNLDCLKFVYDTYRRDQLDLPKGPKLCGVAAAKGNLEVLKFAHENGYEFDVWTCAEAAANGHLSCLKFAHETGCPWDVKTMHGAAVKGHLDCLAYACERGCSWYPFFLGTTADVAAAGQLECLKYLHEHGCLWHKKTLCRALRNGKWDCAIYALLHDAPRQDITKFMVLSMFIALGALFDRYKPFSLGDTVTQTVRIQVGHLIYHVADMFEQVTLFMYVFGLLAILVSIGPLVEYCTLPAFDRF